MTTRDLIKTLEKMRAGATRGDDLTATTLLFGVIFDEHIKNSGSNAADIGKAVGLQQGTTISDGQKLAQFVDPKPGVVRRWSSP